MRAYVVSTLVLAIALLTGCAGRQARVRSVPAPSITESAVAATAPNRIRDIMSIRRLAPSTKNRTASGKM